MQIAEHVNLDVALDASSSGEGLTLAYELFSKVSLLRGRGPRSSHGAHGSRKRSAAHRPAEASSSHRGQSRRAWGDLALSFLFRRLSLLTKPVALASQAPRLGSMQPTR